MFVDILPGTVRFQGMSLSNYLMGCSWLAKTFTTDKLS
jgi:hypothetical protein